MSKIYLATTNPGKLREFQEAAQSLDINLELLPRLQDLPPAIEDGDTFDKNARIQAEHSGLSVDQLGGAPGVYSARYASVLQGKTAGHMNSDDEDNNRALVSQLERLPSGKHAGKYVCVIAVARNGETLACFVGEAPGELLTAPRGTGGFGYDPLFLFPALGMTFAELTLDEKRQYSHRGKAFRQFLDWY